MRGKRSVVAINPNTGERREYDSAYMCARELGTMFQNVTQALDRNGICCGWRLYDSAEYLRGRIAELQKRLKEVEGM